MSAGLGYAHSITRVLTFKSWQIQLNRLAAENHCHDSIMLEVLTKHSNTVNRLFASSCHLCKTDHGPDLLCFHEDNMSSEQQDILRDLLDQSLHFNEGSHQEIFRLCIYFLFREDHILPLFMNSLQPDYARFYDKYSYLQFIFEIAEARYDVLASFLLSYLNRHAYTLFIPPSVLFCAKSLDEFMSAIRSLPNANALTRKAVASTIHLS